MNTIMLIAVALAGWINRQQQDVIEYLREEVRVLRELQGKRRLRFTDDQRSRLAHNGREVVLVEDEVRSPPLERNVVEVEDKEKWLLGFAEELKREEHRSLLVFVSQRARTRTVAKKLGEILGEQHVGDFHAGLGNRTRLERASMLREGTLRSVVATTSLKMGVNLPVTDVVVLDPFVSGGRGRVNLGNSDLAQMMGRAGRGEIEGRSWLIASSGEGEEFLSRLRDGRLEGVEPVWRREKAIGRRNRRNGGEAPTDPLRATVLQELAARAMADSTQIQDHLAHSFAGMRSTIAAGDIRRTLAWCVERKLAFVIEGAADTYQVTKIGRVIGNSGITPETGEMSAGFLRALLRLGEVHARSDGRPENFLSALSDFDLLALVCASFELREKVQRLRASEKLVTEVSGYLEGLPVDEKPLMLKWRNAGDDAFPTRRLLASLRLPHSSSDPEGCEAVYWSLMAGAALLHQNAKGNSVGLLNSMVVVSEGDWEGAWRPLAIWLLRVISSICDPRRAYKMRAIQIRSVTLASNLAIGSDLGPLLRIKGIGLQSILRLKEAGIATTQNLRVCDIKTLAEVGLGRRQVEILTRWLRRGRR